MKKIITLLIITTLGTSWAFGQLGPKPQKPDHQVTETKFPSKEVADKIKQSLDAGEITKEEAKKKLEALRDGQEKGDLQPRPEILTDLEKIDPRKVESEVMAAVKEGKISREDAQKKLGALREEMQKNGGFKRPQRPQKPELSDAVKESLADIKAQQDTLHDAMKAQLAELGNDASKEDMRNAIEAFKADNKDKFEAIKEAHEGIRSSMEAARPAKPERPELTAELKVKVEALKEKHEALHSARKALHDDLKDASKEEKETLITEFKESNKAKHEAIKVKTKEIKEEIRALVETEATRTSDL
jgi:hypothetical protein